MEETFLKTVNEHQGIIYKICRIYRDTREDQADLFQEILLQLCKSYPSFRQESKASTWMYRVALNTALATFRQKKPAVQYYEKIPTSIHPVERDAQSENEARLYDAIRKLHPSERAVISLVLEDYAYQEIAKIIGISENHVGVQVHRIKSKLKLLLT